ncbi:IS3 family transposase, partial [Ammoniphilus sp. CFH 90114]|uniref:IS3 family transposase n=1 Tax=Ammoniphilus sp. CFH 90114 TaxID=2493665 RepID=UPI00100E44D1
KKEVTLDERLEVAQSWIKRKMPVRRVLRVVQVAPSTYYHRLKYPEKQHSSQGGRPIPGYSYTESGQKRTDQKIKSYLLQLISGEESVYGYRKLTSCLRQRYKLVINKKKVYRLCKELQILLPQREKKAKHPRRLANNREITGPNQLWQMDIKYGYVAGKDRHFYLASIIDVFDRCIVAHYRGKTCDKTSIIHTVKQALLRRQLLDLESKPILRTDNGPQFISHDFGDFCEEYGIEHERIPVKSPNKNAYIESFHSILERECYQREVYMTFDEAFEGVDQFIEFYNKRRLHGSLKDHSPAMFLKKWTRNEIQAKKIAV